MRGVRGLDSAKSIALMDGSSVDANCRAGISARCAHITSGTRKLLMLGLAEQRDAALGVRRGDEPDSRVRVLGTHKTLMREVGTPPKIMDESMGHEDGSVQSRYDHITPGMRQALMLALTKMWEEALDARRAMSTGSPVATLDALLKAGR